jgi:hypothetical protein
MAEISLLIIAFAISFLWLSKRKRNKELHAIHQFIDQVEQDVTLNNKPLERLLSDACGLTPQETDNALKDINASERAVLHNVLQLFLQRELSLLKDIDQSISQLSEPYCKLINALSIKRRNPNTQDTHNPEQTNPEQTNQQLKQQLDTALHTIEEITAEYSRVFSGNQTALELENSSKKMLQIFYDAERSIKQNSQP